MTSTTSITCTACGGANAPDDTFCGSCSAFLEWDGAAAQTPAQAGLPVPVHVAAGGAGGADLAPRADPEHRAPQPEAQRPAPRRAAPDGPRDLFCGSCGTGNATGRTFCRSCGQELADVAPEARPGWLARWVRPLWPFGRSPAARGAGERPRSWERNAARQDRRRGLRWPSTISVGKLAIPLMVLSLFGLGLSPLRATITTWGFETYDSVRRKVAPELVEVTPSGAVADSAVQGHPAVAAIDQNSSSYWSEARDGPGIGATLSVSFATPTDLTLIGITNGATETAFAQQPRLRTVQVDMVDVAGEPVTARLELEDTATFRTYPLAGTAISSLTLTIVDVYPGQEGEDASVTELSFRTSR